jgi:5-formyltetrahydrofolate cyclo-ligase
VSVKKELRKRLRDMLASIPPEEIQARSVLACNRLIEQATYRKAEILMVFLSLPSEVDTTSLVLRAWQDRKRVLAPKVSWEQRRMLPVEIRSLTSDVAITQLGIREPISGPPIPIQLIDLVIVPGLGFDGQGNRLGRGRGFYDQFLAHPQFRGVSCALAFEEQMTESVPYDALDVRVNMLVTDKKTHRFDKKR